VLTTPSFSNNGLIQSTGALSITSSADMLVKGTGTLSASSTTIGATGALTLTQAVQTVQGPSTWYGDSITINNSSTISSNSTINLVSGSQSINGTVRTTGFGAAINFSSAGALTLSGNPVAITALLILLAVLPARLLLEPTGSFERRDRHPATSREAMELDQVLGLPDAAIFNVPHPFEVMFYSRYAAYGRLPQPGEIEALHARGIPIFIYQPAGQTVAVPAEWRASVIRGR
jgi:hypothetical protein